MFFLVMSTSQLRKVRISRSFLPKLTRWLKFRGSGPIFFPQTHRISLFRLFFPPFLALFPVFTEISPTDVSFGPPETGWPGWITSPVGYRFSAAPCRGPLGKRNLWSLPFLQHRFWRQVGLLESIRRLNGILFPRLDEFRAWWTSRKYTASMSLSVLQVPQQAGGPLVSSISVFAKPDQ